MIYTLKLLNMHYLVMFQDEKGQEYYLGKREPKVLDKMPPGMVVIYRIMRAVF